MMKKQEIIELLQKNHSHFFELVDSLNESEFNKEFEQKWTPSQQAQHIHQSINPLNKALLLPNWLLKIVIGKANRPSKNYEELVDKYKAALVKGGKAPKRFVPKLVEFQFKKDLIFTLKKDLQTLLKLANKRNEKELDELIIPHPLIGKLTLREMLYFTAYHVTHHHHLIEKIIKN